ncbi:TetR family transcriptional regulator [Nocardioides sp. CFH 31398]|uniref:TetR family transcriptional regulator n=1 Tax=Nocardioides sp. CFH 31398 TaxID=2919579 RepID=UPI001F06730B|nr:TetR family transcriptional regulator [Nocardioides sp. CFH 31398]MCH1866623.1 TetR family transcriptional regulator [Nocardioides sp. CFH 31398]
MASALGEGSLSRVERKERTRRAILDTALDLSADTSLVAVSLRQVAKEVGIVPTAFYRHFASIEALGLELVDESFVSLRAVLRDVRRPEPSLKQLIDASVDVLAEHVEVRRAHFGFIARERVAGPPAVREAVRHQIELVERELATDIARIPGTEAWSSDDLRVLSKLMVTSMVATAEALILAGRPEVTTDIKDQARTQLRMVLVGALNWKSQG